jgi:hypothetical protein
MRNTFSGCNSFNQDVTFYSYDITDARDCFHSTGFNRNVYIYFRYANSINSKTFNSFVSAGYLFSNGVTNNKDGVTVIDLDSI